MSTHGGAGRMTRRAETPHLQCRPSALCAQLVKCPIDVFLVDEVPGWSLKALKKASFLLVFNII